MTQLTSASASQTHRHNDTYGERTTPNVFAEPGNSPIWKCQVNRLGQDRTNAPKISLNSHCYPPIHVTEGNNC